MLFVNPVVKVVRLVPKFAPFVGARSPARHQSNQREFSYSFVYVLIFLAVIVTEKAEQLRFSSIQIPALVQKGSNFVLACLYELEANEQLYSVKWYKGNEEFYKLQFPATTNTNNNDHHHGSSSIDSSLFGQDDQWQSSSSTNYNNHEHNLALAASGLNSAQQQQQYFSQTGVNVRMSLSNATHVHMLNASLESEGSYRCEISTQNLSTIRYEKEIRIYALPQTRLNVAGFRQRYALDDRVDLICSSDFSRPRAALAWFINGERIHQSNRMFEMETRSQTKPGDQSFVRVNISLRFRLNTDLLFWLSKGSAMKNGGNTANLVTTSINYNNNNNQILNIRSDTRNQNSIISQLGGHFIRIQCKYRLSEVSDVAFNDLPLSATDFSSRPQSTLTKSPESSDVSDESSRRKRHLNSVDDLSTSSSSDDHGDSGDADKTDDNCRLVSGQPMDNQTAFYLFPARRFSENSSICPPADRKDAHQRGRKDATNILHHDHNHEPVQKPVTEPNSVHQIGFSAEGSATRSSLVRNRKRKRRQANGPANKRQFPAPTTTIGSGHSASVVVIKSSQENRVIQSESPANELELRRYFNYNHNSNLDLNLNLNFNRQTSRKTHSTTAQTTSTMRHHVGRGVSPVLEATSNSLGSDEKGACSSGALALQPDDPILVQVSGSDLSGSFGSRPLQNANSGSVGSQRKLKQHQAELTSLDRATSADVGHRNRRDNSDNNNLGSDHGGDLQKTWPLNEKFANNNLRQLDMNLNYQTTTMANNDNSNNNNNTSNNDDDDDDGNRPSTPTTTTNGNNDGQGAHWLSIDCMSIAALLNTRPGITSSQSSPAPSSGSFAIIDNAHEPSGEDNFRGITTVPAVSMSQQQQHYVHGVGVSGSVNSLLDSAHQNQGRLCNDDHARRHASISGKSSFNEPPVDLVHTQLTSNSNTNNSRTNKGSFWPSLSNQRVAYLNISAPGSVFLNSREQERQRSLNAFNGKQSARHQHLATSERHARQVKSAQALDQHLQVKHKDIAYSAYQDDISNLMVSDERSSIADAHNNKHQSSSIFAPPLLEWFINNQEAPRSSVNYEHELPLLATTPPAQSSDNNNSSTLQANKDSISGHQPEDTLATDGYRGPVVNFIDYAQYFANFDSNPMEQRLNLKLQLNKKHFMTPDSKLTLRCSSTQAQTLMADVVELRIVLVSNQHTIADHLQHASSSWQKRRVNHNGVGNGFYQLAGNNNLNNPLRTNNPSSKSSLHHQANSNNRVNPLAPVTACQLSMLVTVVTILQVLRFL